MTRGPGGVAVKKYTGKRETFYLCDVDRNGVLRRQSRLSFTRRTPGMEDNPQTQEAKRKKNVSLNTTTGGN